MQYGVSYDAVFKFIYAYKDDIGDISISTSDDAQLFDEKEKVLKIKNDNWKKLAAAATSSGGGGMALAAAINKNRSVNKLQNSKGIISDFMDIWRKEDR